VELCREVRNLSNRTLLALGLPPSTVPRRDHPEVSKLCAIFPELLVKPDDAVLDLESLSQQLDGIFDRFDESEQGMLLRAHEDKQDDDVQTGTLDSADELWIRSRTAL
jgi:hypothetical protein